MKINATYYHNQEKFPKLDYGPFPEVEHYG